MEIRILELSQQAEPQLAPGQVLQLPTPHQPYILRIVLPGTSPVMNHPNAVLLCNYPKSGEEFDREKYQRFDLHAPISGQCEVDIEIMHSGAFSVRIGNEASCASSWDFIIQPPFQLGDKHIDANGLCVQTVLSKLVDPEGDVHSKRWTSLLDHIAEKKYNTIHFVPLQTRGGSDSPFSIADQLSWDKHSFPRGEADVEFLAKELDKRGIMGLTDIVLNHTASDSPWLEEHLDAGYSAETAPHLEAAIALDSALLNIHDVEIHDYSDLSRIEGAVRKCSVDVSLWEFYIINIEQNVATVEKHPFQGKPTSELPQTKEELAALLVEKAGRNFDELGGRFHRKLDSSILAEFVSGSKFSAREILDEVNVKLYAEFNDDLSSAISSIRNRQRYLRLDDDGPKLGPKADPIIETYFNRNYGTPLACNGWVWGGNPLVDHAGPKSKAYVRRDLIVWGDCTKLRYGKRPEDSPYLWKRMSKYTRLMAKHFAGLRVDNAHSTPVHVGEYLLDEARKIRPNLYVVAELFSGSQEMDKLYVERLGMSSLLREAIMPGNPKDLSTMIHANGGISIGSLIDDKYIRGSQTHAWLMEVTHDNEAMAQKRTVEDTLSTAGLVAMCLVSSGSTFGSDEGYATALNVVSEKRPYRLGGGISEAKAFLNELHQSMSEQDMHESYTHLDGQYITVHRVNPESGEGVFLVARTAFFKDADQTLSPIRLEASQAKFERGWAISSPGKPSEDDNKNNKEQIPVIPIELKDLKISPEVDDKGTTITLPSSADFPQGSVAVFRTCRQFDVEKLETLVREDADEAVKELDLLDLNVLLYHAQGEEQACSDWKRGIYNVPDMGLLVYAGLQGWETHLSTIVAEQNLGHPICANVRAGPWAFEYLRDRLPNDSQFDGSRKYLNERIELIHEVPAFMRPRYFIATILQLYKGAVNHAMDLLHINNEHTSRFYKLLSLTSIQMVAQLPNCSLFPDKQVPTMAAGLPHFSEGIMRCWGRDVFLSVGGLLTLHKRFKEAEDHILGFGATLKYGLIPNLLDSGRNPRYNARDAVWFFVECIQQLCERQKSYDLLKAKVRRRFPLDDSYTDTTTDHESTVADLVYEVLSRHAAGIEFREHNAGPNIDSNMSDNGFNQKIWVDWSNGFVFGGNQDNCGTWMDKMGESKQAKNNGVPGTPRDGAAVEITGLLKSCLRWVNKTRREEKWGWPKTVKNQHGDEIELEKWEQLIQDNFERCYYIPEDIEMDDHYDVDQSVINRRGIYKDTYRSGKLYEDYQLRPNFTVALLSAPELFDDDRAQQALEIADEVLRGPVGMATLDPSDWNYRPYYLNSIDNSDFATSKGRNYHQGPEWVWLFGTFLQAYVDTLRRKGTPTDEILAFVRTRVQGHIKWIEQSPWRGLTELTQKDGEFCGDSSPTQAWSSARLLEALYSVTQCQL